MLKVRINGRDHDISFFERISGEEFTIENVELCYRRGGMTEAEYKNAKKLFGDNGRIRPELRGQPPQKPEEA